MAVIANLATWPPCCTGCSRCDPCPPLDGLLGGPSIPKSIPLACLLGQPIQHVAQSSRLHAKTQARPWLLSIRHLTIAFRNSTTVLPSCRKGWEDALKIEGLSWHLVYQRIYHPALTSRDRKNNMRILN
eukprot:2421016-Prymnesium_polylepis.1